MGHEIHKSSGRQRADPERLIGPFARRLQFGPVLFKGMRAF